MKAQKVQKTILRWDPGGAPLEVWRLVETSGDFWGGARKHPYTKNYLYHTKLPITRPWRLYW